MTKVYSCIETKKYRYTISGGEGGDGESYAALLLMFSLGPVQDTKRRGRRGEKGPTWTSSVVYFDNSIKVPYKNNEPFTGGMMCGIQSVRRCAVPVRIELLCWIPTLNDAKVLRWAPLPV